MRTPPAAIAHQRLVPLLLAAGFFCPAFGQQTPPPEVKVTISVDRDAQAQTIADLLIAGVQACAARQYDKAISSFNEALEMNPDDQLKATIYADRGGAHGFKGEPGKAIEDFNEAIRIDPKC